MTRQHASLILVSQSCMYFGPFRGCVNPTEHVCCTLLLHPVTAAYVPFFITFLFTSLVSTTLIRSCNACTNQPLPTGSTFRRAWRGHRGTDVDLDGGRGCYGSHSWSKCSTPSSHAVLEEAKGINNIPFTLLYSWLPDLSYRLPSASEHKFVPSMAEHSTRWRNWLISSVPKNYTSGWTPSSCM